MAHTSLVEQGHLVLITGGALAASGFYQLTLDWFKQKIRFDILFVSKISLNYGRKMMLCYADNM